MKKMPSQGPGAAIVELPPCRRRPATWPALREAFGEVRPAATMRAVGLADPRMRIGIEVPALRRR